MAKVLITTLGMVDGVDRETGKIIKAIYGFDKSILDTTKTVETINVFTLFVRLFGDTHSIIPLYTQGSLKQQQKALKNDDLEFDIEKNGKQIDENSVEDIFEKIYQLLESKEYDEIIVDVSHGFRSIPILQTIAMSIKNFKNSKKITNIIYAQEDFENKGKYLVKDLKPYLDLSNIAFILTNFENNYTISTHIESKEYQSLIDSMNAFSNDLMSLSLNNLFKKSSKQLSKELGKIDEVSIKAQAQELKEHIDSAFGFKDKKYYMTYYDLAKNLFDKSYLLLSLSLLYESSRLYIKTTIKKEHKEIVEDVEKEFKDDLYKIGDFFKNLSWKSYSKYTKDKNKISISENSYNKLKNSFPKNIKELVKEIGDTRNNLSHANSKKTFKDVKDDIKGLFDDYYEKCIKQKDANDLQNYFNN